MLYGIEKLFPYIWGLEFLVWFMGFWISSLAQFISPTQLDLVDSIFILLYCLQSWHDHIQNLILNYIN